MPHQNIKGASKWHVQSTSGRSQWRWGAMNRIWPKTWSFPIIAAYGFRSLKLVVSVVFFCLSGAFGGWWWLVTPTNGSFRKDGMAPKTPKTWWKSWKALPVGNEGMKLYMLMMGMKLNPHSLLLGPTSFWGVLRKFLWNLLGYFHVTFPRHIDKSWQIVFLGWELSHRQALKMLGSNQAHFEDRKEISAWASFPWDHVGPTFNPVSQRP